MRRSVLFLVVSGLVFQSGAGLADVKLGHIDSEILKEQLPELRQVRRQLEQLEQEFQRDLSERESKLVQLQDEFRRQELLWSEARKVQMQADFDDKMRELQEYGQKKFGPEGELMQKNIQFSTPIFEQINVALKAIAEEEGYDFIFDVAGNSAIVYADEKHDLTDKLMKRLKEEREEAEKGK